MPASKRRRPRQRPPAPRGVLVVLILVLLTGCLQTPPHVVKIGLVAPFEGRYREIGYDVIPAARLAVREWAARPESRGLGQFYALTEGEAEGVYFVSGAAEAEDSGWPPEQLEAFIAGYEEGSLGAPPGLLSLTAYQATWVAIREAAAREGIPLSGTPVDSLAFDADGRRLDPPVYLYLWRAGQRSFIEQLR